MVVSSNVTGYLATLLWPQPALLLPPNASDLDPEIRKSICQTLLSLVRCLQFPPYPMDMVPFKTLVFDTLNKTNSFAVMNPLFFMGFGCTSKNRNMSLTWASWKILVDIWQELTPTLLLVKVTLSTHIFSLKNHHSNISTVAFGTSCKSVLKPHARYLHNPSSKRSCCAW